MTAQAAELASGKAQSFLSSKAGFRQPNRGPSPSGTSRLLFCTWVIPFGYVPTTFLIMGHPLRGSVPFGYVPTTFLLRGPSISGVIPFGYIPTTFLLRGPSPSGTSRLLAQGSIPFGYIPTTFLLKGHPLRGSVPFGYVPTTFQHWGHPLRIQDMLLEAVNFAPVTRNGQKRLPSLIGSIQDSFRKTTTTATSGSELAVGSRRPCSNIPSGASVAMTVRVDPTTLGTNDHHGHLEGSLGYPRPPTLPQNSIGSFRGDVRPDLCQSGLSIIPAGSVWCHSGLFNGKQPKLDPSTV
ncbi:hypothetical protein CRG98_017968 [Punica granatum]|uniref:Uncharacterized protein n=1 Tax=Punica granatum TaxID=22663 RepID=A0A2I0JZ80_PUNGR|nr:hypothetical protein CRG98_017968 [Punica granatum]